MEIEFVASSSPIVEDIASARSFYGEQLGTDFEGGARTTTPARNGPTASSTWALLPLAAAAG